MGFGDSGGGGGGGGVLRISGTVMSLIDACSDFRATRCKTLQREMQEFHYPHFPLSSNALTIND